MKNLLLLAFLLPFCSCSDDDVSSSSLKIFVDGEPVKIERFNASFSQAFWDAYGTESMSVAAILENGGTFNVIVFDHGPIVDGMLLEGALILSNKTYLNVYDKETVDEASCFTDSEGNSHCDNFSLSFIANDNAYLAKPVPDFTTQVVITTVDYQHKRVSGSFDVIAVKSPENGNSVHITGTFKNLQFVSSF